VTDWTQGRVGLIRTGIGILAFNAALVGVWATFAPRSFYDDFPGAGKGWVNPLGAYDEHLVRDVGALYLALLSLAIFALVTLDRRVVQATAVAYAVVGLPHLIFHLANTGPLTTADNVISLAGLFAVLVIPLALLPMTRARSTTPR
jgi:hypothetical protein